MEHRTRAILGMAEEHSGAQFERGVKPHKIPEYFDCSSFVRYVFEHAFGVIIPRRAFMQAECGDIIANMEELQPGDLLFFEGNPPSQEHVVLGDRGYWVGHVAIYAGENTIAHCTRKDGVHVSPLDAYCREKKLVLMKRILPDNIRPSA